MSILKGKTIRFVIFSVLILIGVSYIVFFPPWSNEEIPFSHHKVFNLSGGIREMVVSHDNDMMVWVEPNSKIKRDRILSLKTDGTDYKELLVFPGEIEDLQLSFDDKAIYFLSKNGSSPYFIEGDLYQMDIEGTSYELLLSNITDFFVLDEFEFIIEIADYNQTFITYHENLFYYNFKTNETIKLTTYFDRNESGHKPWVVECMDYQPLEKYIIYYLSTFGSTERRSDETQYAKNGIYRININGTGYKCLLEMRDMWAGCFSPDYNKILFQTGRSSHSKPLWIMDKDGRNTKQLTNLDEGPRDYVGKAFITADGKRIVYGNTIAYKNDNILDFTQVEHHNIWMMNIDGSEKELITPDDTSYKILLMGPNGKNLYYYLPGEIWVMRVV